MLIYCSIFYQAPLVLFQYLEIRGQRGSNESNICEIELTELDSYM